MNQSKTDFSGQTNKIVAEPTTSKTPEPFSIPLPVSAVETKSSKPAPLNLSAEELKKELEATLLDIENFRKANPPVGSVFDQMRGTKPCDPNLINLEKKYETLLGDLAMLKNGFTNVNVISVEPDYITTDGQIYEDTEESNNCIGLLNAFKPKIKNLLFYCTKRRERPLREATSENEPSTGQLIENYEETLFKMAELEMEHKRLVKKYAKINSELDSRIVPSDFAGSLYDPYKLEAQAQKNG